MPAITAELTTGTTVQLSNGRHTWAADEPPEAGGDDTAPTPYELLLGALAACTCITLALYARHKTIPLHRVTTQYTFDRVHADDCAECDDDATGFIDRVTGTVAIEADADAAQQARLRQVAVRCPVHKTLERGIVFADAVTVTAQSG